MTIAPARDARLLTLLLVVVAAVVFGVAAWRFLDSPLRFDEAEWPPQAEGILRHGAPKILYSEHQRLFVREFHGYDAHYGMWHPPLYQYSLALALAAFGRENWAIRGVSLGWCALGGWLAWLVVARASVADRRHVALAAITCATLCPLILEGSFFVDIDNSSLCAAVFLLAYLHVTLDDERPWRRAAWLTLVMVVALWTKLTTPFFMLAAMLCDSVMRRHFKRAAIDALTVGVGGAALFAITYWMYCWALDYPPRFMFDITYLGKRDQFLTAQTATRILHSLRWNAVWLSLPLTMAFAWVTARRVQRWVRNRGSEPADVLLFFALITFAAYGVAGAVMGKYTVPAAVATVMLVSAEAVRALDKVRFERYVVLAVAAAALAAVHLWVVPPLTVRPPGITAPSTLAQAALDPRNRDLALALGAGVAAATAFGYSVRSIQPGGRIIAGLLLWMLVANSVMQLQVATAPFDRSPLRPFQDRGFEEVVAFLNEHTSGDIVLCPKDVGYYYRGRHYALEGEGDSGTVAERMPAMRAGGVRWAVDSAKYPLVRDANWFEDAGFRRWTTVGDYVVYRAR